MKGFEHRSRARPKEDRALHAWKGGADLLEFSGERLGAGAGNFRRMDRRRLDRDIDDDVPSSSIKPVKVK